MDANGNPAAGAIVLYEGPDAMMEQSRTVTADGQGRFTITGFKKGAVLRARRAEGSAEATLKMMAVKDPSDDLMVELSATGRFSLLVKTVGVDGKVVPHATMSLIKMGARSGMGGMALAVNGDGTIQFENLYKDYRYSVMGTAPGYGETQVAVKTSGEADVQQTVTVTLKKADTPVAGTVRDEMGKGMADVEVQRNGSNGAASTRTDGEGHFKFMVAEGDPETTMFVRGSEASRKAKNVTAGG